MTTTSEVGSVTVPGGDLAYEVLSGSTEPVLAIHGISSHRRLWSWLHAEAPELTLVTPDLRGRADSVEVAGSLRRSPGTPTTWRRCSTPSAWTGFRSSGCRWVASSPSPCDTAIPNGSPA